MACMLPTLLLLGSFVGWALTRTRFLLAELHMDSLAHQTKLKPIREWLRKLPIGSAALDFAYDEAVKRIKSQHPNSIALARRALAWIVHAQRPLAVEELLHALAVEVGTKDIDAENIDDINAIIVACVGLVVVNEGTVRHLHYTAPEYLMRTESLQLPEPHEIIASSCLTYLQFRVFSEGACFEKVPIRPDCFDAIPGIENTAVSERLRRYPFVQYAARYWGYHSLHCSGETVASSLMSFLHKRHLVSSARQVLSHNKHDFYDEQLPYYPDEALRKQMQCSDFCGALHLATYLGLEEIVVKLLDEGFDPND